MLGKRKIIEIGLRESKEVKREDRVAVDKLINIFVNGAHFVTLLASPQDIRELTLGHLLGEGVINSLEDIEQLGVRGTKVDVRTKGGAEPAAAKSLRVIPTACGASEGTAQLLGKSRVARAKSKAKFEARNISNAFRSLHSAAKVFQRTGGTHAAALFNSSGEMKFCLEDVGRHNAVDKIIGRGAIEGVDFSECFLVSSGRLSADLVIKCARAGVPLVASRAAPLESGILAAEMSGLTLVGFVRGVRLNVYVHPERVRV
jgi:FdhD protein